MRALAASALVLLSACGPARAPLPPPAAARSWVPRLPRPPQDPRRPMTPELPPVVSFTLSNGLTVQIVEQRALPVVSMALVGRGPTGDDSAEMAALLEMALSGRLSSDEDEQEVGQHTETVVHERGIVFRSLRMASDLEWGLRAYSALFAGQAPADDRVVQARTALVERARFAARQRARSRVPPASEELFARLYGEGHVRVRRMRMRASRLERIAPADVRRHLASLLSDSALVIVGDVDAAAVEASARRQLEPLPAPAVRGRSIERRVPEFPEPATRLRIFGTRPEPSAYLRLVERGPPIEHEDHPAFRLYARLAGGMFSSALNLQLRESRGESYGVATRVADRVDHSILDIQLVVPVASASSAAQTIVAELARLSDASRIDAAELEIARSVELAELSSSLDTCTGLGGALVSAFLARRPPSSILETFRRVATLDAAAVAAAGRRWVRSEKAPMIIIGDYVWLFTHPVRVPGGVDFVR